MFSDNSIFFLILDNINHFANSAAHIHDVHFYFRCPNALSENLKDAAKKIVVLWTNPEWNSSTNLTPFVAQEIQIDNISDFDMIGICHSCYNNTCNYFNFFLNIFNKEINLIETFSNIKSTEYYVRLYYRKFIITQSGIKFDIGYSSSHTQVAADNSYAIPVKIIGIKF